MFKKMLLCLLCLTLMIPAACAETTLRIAAEWMPEEVTAYPDADIELIESHEVFDDMASAFAAQNDQIDLFVFSARGGLFSVKRHGYFAPLNDSEILMKKLENLYEPFRGVLTTDEGQMVGWIVSADILCMDVRRDVLDEVGLAMPETFDELLDVCEALVDSDAVPVGYSLLGDTAYDRQSVMDLYMEQYIRASQQRGGTVDFANPAFAKMAERIRSSVPENDPMPGDPMMGEGVFMIPIGYNIPSEDMYALPTVLEGKQGGMESSVMVMTVNPYSANRDAAIACLEWVATNSMDPTIDATLNEPFKDKYMLEWIDEMKANIAALEAVEDPTPEQKDELTMLRVQLENAENSWTVSAADIARYQQIVGGMYISEASPVTYDDVLKTAVQRFLGGAFDAEGFAKECQDHISMIYQEYGIAMN